MICNKLHELLSTILTSWAELLNGTDISILVAEISFHSDKIRFNVTELARLPETGHSQITRAKNKHSMPVLYENLRYHKESFDRPKNLLL